jgi:hypothetical protein
VHFEHVRLSGQQTILFQQSTEKVSEQWASQQCEIIREAMVDGLSNTDAATTILSSAIGQPFKREKVNRFRNAGRC